MPTNPVHEYSWNAATHAAERQKEQFFDDIKNGDAVAVRAVIEKTPAAMRWKHPKRFAEWSPFLTAIGAGQQDIVRLFVEKGYDINKPVGEEDSGLCWAIVKKQAAIAHFLLDHKADPNVRGVVVIEDPEDDNADPVTSVNDTCLMEAIMRKDFLLTERLLKNGADVNAISSDGGYTPLMCAVFAGDADIACLLLEYKADRFIKDDAGKTAIDYAHERGLEKIADLIQRNQPFDDTVLKEGVVIAEKPPVRVRFKGPKP